MAYFIPSSIQKRLLRYALSRLEFFDTDALDLDRLEIGWGRKSTVELKHVALRRAKLSSLLKLPSRLSIQDATVALLRVTVPADLHTASIVIEIQGVNAIARLLEDDQRDSPSTPTPSIAKQSQDAIPKSKRRAKSPPLRREPLSHTDSFSSVENNGLDAIPSPHDLAASFLAEEPAEEKEQLEAAMNSQSVDLRQSAASVDSGDDGLAYGTAYGTGVGLSLPAFLADFLKGIGDRLQVVVNGLSVKLHVKLEPSFDDTSRLSEVGNVSETTLGLNIDVVKVYQAGDPSTPQQETPVSDREIHIGARCVSIHGITGSLISDAATFAQLSQVFDRNSDGSSGLETTNAKCNPSVSNSQPSQGTTLASAVDSRSPLDNILAWSERPRDSVSNRAGGNVEEELLHPSNISVDFRDPPSATEDGDADHSAYDNSLEASASSVRVGDYSLPLDSSQSPSTYLQSALRKFREERLSSSERRARQLHEPLEDFWVHEDDVSPQRSTASSMAVPGALQSEIDNLSTSEPSQGADGFPEATHENQDEISTTFDQDALLESRVFSQDEAESIYMSAVYDAPTDQSGQFLVPGGWAASANLNDQAADRGPSNRSYHDFEESTLTQPTLSPSQENQQTETPLYNTGVATPSYEESQSDQPIEKSFLASTPVSPTEKLSIRTLFHVSEGRLWLPQSGAESSEPDSVAPSNTLKKPFEVLTRSEYQSIPGAYSVYAESHSSLLKGSRKIVEGGEELRTRIHSERVSKSPSIRESSVELSFGAIKVRVDAFTSRLLILVARKIQSAFSSADTSSPQRNELKSDDSQKNTSNTALNITLASINISFVESVADRTFDPSTAPSDYSANYDSQSEKALFKLSVNEMSLNAPDISSINEARLEVGQIKFGFADEDIISFNRETRLRTSLRDVREVSDKDLSIEISQINGNREIHLATQPIKLTINLQKIDNTLGSIGGLSGLLELGSSITSDTTVMSPTPKPAQPRSRTVRFDSSTKLSPEPANSSQPRFNVKISGTDVLLKGNSCSVGWQSSAIKLVSRHTLIGVKIDEIRLSGPHISHKAEKAALMVRLRDTRLTYMFSPEEHDLTRLISLLTPSKDKFEDDDDFLVDTLVRQRKKGSVLRASVKKLNVDYEEVGAIDTFKELSTEMSKMSAVTKFLPKESRPGLLTLGLIDSISLRAQTGLKLGEVCAELSRTEVAHVSAPSLVALAIGKLAVEAENNEKLITAVLPENCNGVQPMLMTRMIEDELEPMVRIKLWNTCFEYSVPTLMAMLDRDDTVTGKEVADDLAASIANLLERPGIQKRTTQSSYNSDISKSDPRPLRLDLAFRECALGLKPRSMPSKCLFVMTDTRILSGLPSPHGFKLSLELRKAGVLLINDTQKLVIEDHPKSQDVEPMRGQFLSQVESLCHQGYVSVTSISAASISLNVTNDAEEGTSSVDVEMKDKLFVLETCADSTQTLIETLNDLMPPTPPSKGQKYRTEIAPVEDMMASFTGDAFAIAPQDANQLDMEEDYFDSQLANDFDDFGHIPSPEPDMLSDEGNEILEDYFAGDQDDYDDDFVEGHIAALQPLKRQEDSISGGFAPGILPPRVQGTANRWDSAKNKYVPVKKSELTANPLKVRIRDTHIIWNLYDGYDWEQTRDTITKAVQDVETRAAERRQGKRTTLEDDQDEESVIGDFLFNSIYIGVPLNHDPKELSRQINRNIDDLVSETGSHTPSHVSTTTSRPASSHRARSHGRRKLKLNRSRRHKIAFELRGVSVDFFVFQPGGETQSSTDIRINDFEIFDHVPTSTWKKFATYMHDAGPREDNKPMLHLEICDVRPVPELTAAELVIRVTVLPLRLHVDQDALDFITRFFEFNDDSKSPGGPQAEQPYLQRVEVRPVPVKLDYKPKKIDYAGLRSGRTTEFMNFFILDGAEFILKHVVVYGTSGFLKLHKSLEDVWMPDVKKNQLPSVLSGLNGVRTFVNVGTGVRDLVAIPIREYHKDGRIVRSISKGAMAFARTTGSELTKLGAKVAIGAQTALQGAEELLAKPSAPQDSGWEDMELDAEEKRAISHYANQPTGILQGLKGAARSLERDLLVTRDIIVAISGEVRESTTAEGAALAVARHAPTLILRPMIGATKAISQTLMGATNTVDPQNRRRVEDKYKRY